MPVKKKGTGRWKCNANAGTVKYVHCFVFSDFTVKMYVWCMYVWEKFSLKDISCIHSKQVVCLLYRQQELKKYINK